jgi:hypothetical protein
MKETRRRGDHVELSRPESNQVHHVTKGFEERAKRPMNLNQLIRDWNLFVREVANGYGLGLDEYMNDLSTRDLLEELMAGIDAEPAGKILTAITHADDEYAAATAEVGAPLQPARAHRWWYRVPRRADGDLQDDLRRAGFIV